MADRLELSTHLPGIAIDTGRAVVREGGASGEIRVLVSVSDCSLDRYSRATSLGASTGTAGRMFRVSPATTPRS